MSLVAIFAHPDDEAFGPGGTLAKFASDEDVYLICVTNGNDKTRDYENGVKERGLSNIRHEELENSAKILGIKKVFYLGFEDGELCNNLYHKVAEKIETILEELRPDKLLTFETRGVSGHIDHIFLAMVTNFIFQRQEFIKKIYFYCLNKEDHKDDPKYFIYFPEGYGKEEIDEVIDVSDFWDKKVAAIMAHTSQLDDPNKIPEWLNNSPKKENFLVRKK